MPSRAVAVTFVVVVTLVAAALATARGGEASTTARTIASTSTSDFRVVVTAAQLDEGPSPSAALTATTFTRAENRWRRTGRHRLGGSYFWKTVTGPRAVCRLEMRTTGSSAAFKPRAIVQLLVTPSLGCGPAERVFVE
jgi:hypothetical protein